VSRNQTDDFTGYNEALPLKSALESLLGADEWYHLKDSRDLKTWRRSLLKAMKVSEVAIASTVEVVDEDWRKAASSIIDHGRESVAASRSIREAFSAFAACYLQLSFHQLGFLPNRVGRAGKVAAIPTNWRLNVYRSVQYTQTDQQKLRLLYAKDHRPISQKLSDPMYRRLRNS